MKTIPLKLRIILAAAVIFCMSAAGAYAESSHTEAEDIMTGLFLSEKYDGAEIKPDDEMTRGEFVYRINVFDRGIDKKMPFTVLSPYLDVDMEYEYYNDIAYAAHMGYISGGDRFFPEETITVNEAVSIAVRRLGYEANAEIRGGFPNGYRYVANQLGLLKNVSGTVLTRENSIQLLYNMTRTYSQTVTGMTGGVNGFLNYDKSEVFLEETLGIYRATGVVQAIGGESLSDESYSQNTIVTDSGRYYINFVKTGDVLGQKVLYYYEEADSMSAEGTLLYIAPYKMEDYELVIDAKDVKLVADAKITYTEKNANKTQRIDAKTNIIYNGRPLYENVEEVLGGVRRGSFSFYDADHDGDYETLVVQSLKDYVVKQYNSYGDYTAFENAAPLYNSDDVQMWLEMPSGVMSYDMVSLKSGDVMSVYISLDGSIIKGRVARESIHATVTGVDVDGNKTIVYLDGEEYTLSPDFEEEIKTGTEADFLLNAAGEIAYTATDSRVNKFRPGILTRIQINEESEEAELVIFTSGGEKEILPVKEKYILDGIARKHLADVYGVYIETGFAPEEYSSLFGDGIKAKRDMIRYKVNDDGQITEIDTSIYNKSYEDKNDTLILLSNGYTSTPDSYGADVKHEIIADKNAGIASEGQSYSRTLKKLSGNTDVYITDDTMYYTVPADSSNARDKDYTVQPAVTGMTSGSTYWTMTYSESTDDVCASLVVCYPSISESESMSPDTVPAIITNIRTIDDDGDLVTCIEYTVYGSKRVQSYEQTCTNEELWQNVKPMVSKLTGTEAETEGYKLARGDLVRIQTNSFNEIERIELIYRCVADEMVSANPCGQSSGKYGTNAKNDRFRLVDSYVLSRKDDFVTISVGKPYYLNGEITGDSVETHRIDVPILIYNKNLRGSDALRVGSVEDLKSYKDFGLNMSRMFLYTRYETPGVVYVYTEE